MKKLKIWMQNARKASLAQSMLPAILAVVIAINEAEFNIYLAILAVLGVVSAHSGMNLADDFFDYKVNTAESRKELSRQGIRARIVKYPYLTSNESTLQHFPYKFELVIDYILENQTLTARIFVKNLDQKALHFNFGLHPAFKVPWNESEKFEDYTIKFNKPVNANLPTVLLDSGLIDWKQIYKKMENVSEIQLNHEDYSHDALCIEPYPGTPILLESPSKESIELNAPCFKTLGIWTPYPTEAPFICLEPWYGCADNPETNHHYLDKKDLIKLEANEIWINTYQIKINC